MTGRTDSIAFAPGRIGNLNIKNHFVRLATFEDAATPQGEVTDDLVDLYRDLAKGGIGLIITRIACVYAKAVVPRQMRIDDYRYIERPQRKQNVARDYGARIAFVDYNGGEAFDAYKHDPPTTEADEIEFVKSVAPRIVEGIEQLEAYVKIITS